MKVVLSIEEARSIRGPKCVAIGFFDGVHIGHQKIIGAVVRESQKRGLLSTAITFEPHPLRVLKTETPPPLLTPLDKKLELLASLGLDACAVLSFSPDFAGLSAEEFSRCVLKDGFEPRLVCVGYNFTFGHRGVGTPDTLRELGRKLGFRVKVFAPVKVGGVTVSSTAVRELVAGGRVKEARRLLGRPFSIRGEVVAGDGRGRQMGIPTANLVPPPEQLLPADGVYAVVVKARGRSYVGVTNVGRRPTFPSPRRLVEAHLLDYSGHLYGQDIEVFFLEWLRAEQTFPDAEALRRQVVLDSQKARRLAGPEGGSGIEAL